MNIINSDFKIIITSPRDLLDAYYTIEPVKNFSLQMSFNSQRESMVVSETRG